MFIIKGIKKDADEKLQRRSRTVKRLCSLWAGHSLRSAVCSAGYNSFQSFEGLFEGRMSYLVLCQLETS